MITLVLGGARSGKSAFAERLAGRSSPPVTYVATAVVGDDADLAERVRRHRERRPAAWTTAECGPDLIGWLSAAAPAGHGGTTLVESLGTWLAAQPGFAADADLLCRALEGRKGHTIVVSEEVGLGVHPSSEAGQRFRDALGELNQAVSAAAGTAYLVVAGRALRLERAAGE